jgi:hypothetical protein
MATFNGLFDFQDDLSEGQSELSSPPNSSDDEHSDEHTEDEKDQWYDLPSNSLDEEDDLTAPSYTLPIRPATLSALIVSTTPRKEHSTRARIKAIYMLKERKSLSQILAATRIAKSNVYRLIAVAKERGWRENENMPLKVNHVLNAPRSSRPRISLKAIKCVLKVVL